MKILERAEGAADWADSHYIYWAVLAVIMLLGFWVFTKMAWYYALIAIAIAAGLAYLVLSKA